MRESFMDGLCLSRRDLLRRSGMGLGMLGFAGLLDTEGLLAPPASAARPRAQGAA